MKENTMKVTVTIKDVLGTSRPFRQGGSWRLTLPRRVVRSFGWKSDKESQIMIFVETDKGILIVPLKELVTPETLRDSLG